MEKQEASSINPLEEESRSIDEESKELAPTIEQHVSWDGRMMIKYGGFWCPTVFLPRILSCRKHFNAKDTDILLATMQKSGTTWLKALTFSIVRRDVYTVDQSPLLRSSPHELVPALEYSIYWDEDNPDLQHLPSPRLFATHMPYKILPQSILESGCKIIHISRNPLDQFISHHHFVNENIELQTEECLQMNEAFQLFCKGIHPCGPFWENMLGFWNAHLESPHKVLFLRYEDLKEDIHFNVKKIAEFLGFPFSPEEEKEGLIERISSLCSFENLSNLEVNKNGTLTKIRVKTSSFFRKGEIGDWTNYLTPAMAEQIKEIMKIKFEGSGLSFDTLK